MQLWCVMSNSRIFVYLLTYSMEQSPSWEANRFWASQEIPLILYNLKVHCRVYKSPPCVPILSHIQSMPPHPTSWRSILILSSHLSVGLTSGLFPSGFHTKTLYTTLLSPIRATCPAHFIILDLITQIIFGEEYSSLTLRRLMSYIYGAPILDVSRSHTTTQHSR